MRKYAVYAHRPEHSMSNRIPDKQLKTFSIEELIRLRTSVNRILSEKRKTADQTKRGPKSSKVADAFRAIPEEPTLAEEFCAKHGISLGVLRQVKRFDDPNMKERANVMKLHPRGKMYVWRGDKNRLFEMLEKSISED